MLTKRHIEILKLLLAQPEGDGKEIVCDGRSCAVGYERISRYWLVFGQNRPPDDGN